MEDGVSVLITGVRDGVGAETCYEGVEVVEIAITAREEKIVCVLG